MSAPLKLSSTELRQLAVALDELTRLTEETGVEFCAYGSIDVGINNSYVRVAHIEGEYIIDDYTGS